MKTPHGSYQLSLDGNMVYMRCAGMFNGLTASLYVQEAKALIESLCGQGFLFLEDIRHLEGATPEAYVILNQFNQWVNTQQMTAKAVIISNPIVARIARERMDSLKLQNIQYYNSIDDALLWFDGMQMQLKAG